MDDKLVRTFLQVAASGSILAAAEELGYAQSSVTSQIRALEDRLGKALFIRLPRGVSLTEEGRVFERYARRYEQLTDALKRDLSGDRPLKGMIRVIALESFVVYRVMGVLATFLNEHPEVRLELETGYQKEITDGVRKGLFDLGLIPNDPADETLGFEPLEIVELALVGSRSSDMQGAELSRYPLISFDPGCVYRQASVDQFRLLGVEPESEMRFNSLEMIKEAVKCGMGVSLLPLHAIRSELADGTLIELDWTPRVRMTHGFVARKRQPLSEAAEALKTFVTKAMAKQQSEY